KYLNIINSGHCANGCVTITHSTGGLVLDMLLTRANESGISGAQAKIINNTILGVEIASAAGGVKATDIAVDVLESANCSWGIGEFVIETTLKVLGVDYDCDHPESLGATYDLNVAVARANNHSDSVTIPILNVAGYGHFTNDIMKPFLEGTNDGVVAMHSSCGGNRFGSYESCSRTLGKDGEYNDTFNAPNTYKNHFPYIMTEEGHGSELYPCLVDFHISVLSDDPLDGLVCVVPFIKYRTETVVSNYGYSNLDNSKKTTEGMWWWKSYFKRLDDNKEIYNSPAGKISGHLSTHVINHFYW
ncbi:MAG: hypothetical protein HQM12_23760, partial [SAR324 cluster bacterium]|nr:hypothetical protein [SAR324 cluster bacterium]